MDAQERALHLLTKCCYGPTRHELVAEQIRQAEQAAREKALEEAALEAETYFQRGSWAGADKGQLIAAAIRALKEKP